MATTGGDWVPAPGQPGFYICLRHPAEQPFASGRVCPGCVIDPGPPIDTSEPAAPLEDVSDLPTLVAHERHNLRDADRIAKSAGKLLSFADRELADSAARSKSIKARLRKLEESPPVDPETIKAIAAESRIADMALMRAISAYNSAAKLKAEEGKLRRAGIEHTVYREDGVRVRSLEAAVREIHARKGAAN